MADDSTIRDDGMPTPAEPKASPVNSPDPEEPGHEDKPDQQASASRGHVPRWVCVSVVVLVAAAAVPCWYGVRSVVAGQCQQDCRAAQEEGDWQRLQEASDRWLWWQSLHGQALVYRALASEQTGQPEAAVKFLERIPDEDEFAFTGRLALIDILLLNLNRPSQAEAMCRQMLQNRPDATAVHLRLLHIYSSTLQHLKLHDQIRNAIALKAEPVAAWPMLFQLDQYLPVSGYTAVTRWKVEEPDNESLIVAQAIYAHEQRRSNRQEPTDLLDRTAERFPENCDLLAYRIEVALIDYDVASAAALLQAAPDSALRDSRFWRFKASVHEDRNEIDLALSSVRKSLDLYPLSWRSQKLLAGLHRGRGEKGDATKLATLSSEGKRIEDLLNSLPDFDTWLAIPNLPKIMTEYASLSSDPDAELLIVRLTQ